MKTFTLPNGVKVRTRSERRFIVCDTDGRVLLRTDNPSTAYKRWTGAGWVMDTENFSGPVVLYGKREV